MLIAQITDIHLGFPYDNLRDLYAERLRRTVKKLCEMEPRPDLVLCTGDLTEAGDLESFKELREALKPLPFPYFLAVGNHDLRGPLLEAFPEVRTAGGFVQYVIDQGPLRIIVLDTLEEGRHAGAFGPERAAWLKARLDEAPDRPTLLVLHHPPVVTGIDWMSLDPRETWAPRLTAIVKGRKQVIGALAGHMHRPIVAPWAGTVLRVSSSVAPQVTLDLKPIDLDKPDERPLVWAEAPAYALHIWSPETGLVTHFGTVEEPRTTLKYEGWFQKILRHFEEERTQEPAAEGGAAPVEVGVFSSIVRSLFSFRGRMPRGPFWAWSVGAALLAWAVGLAFPSGASSYWDASVPRSYVAPVVWLFCLWPLLALAAKRGHDRGRRAWWLILLFIPVLGQLYWLIDLGLLPGERGANRYG